MTVRLVRTKAMKKTHRENLYSNISLKPWIKFPFFACNPPGHGGQWEKGTGRSSLAGLLSSARIKLDIGWWIREN